jgi:hypothetical protein
VRQLDLERHVLDLDAIRTDFLHNAAIAYPVDAGPAVSCG